MSIWGAFNSSSNAMMAQSTGLNVISQNIANTNTNGYKKVDAEFKTMLSNSTPAVDFYSVRPAVRQLVNIQGQVQGTGRSFDVAINGDGFFIIGKNAIDPTLVSTSTAAPTENLYTRNGGFVSQNYNSGSATLSESILATDSGRPVLGYAIDPDTGAVGSTLGLVKTKIVSSVVGTPDVLGIATTEASIQGNIDATQPSTVQGISIPVNDAAFAVRTLDMQWTSAAPNSWDVKFTTMTGSSIVATPKTVHTTEAATAAAAKTAADTAFENAYDAAFVAAGGVAGSAALNAGVIAAKAAKTTNDAALMTAITAAKGDLTAAGVVAADAAKAGTDAAFEAAYDAAYVAAGLGGAGVVGAVAGVVAAKATKTAADTEARATAATAANPAIVRVTFNGDGEILTDSPLTTAITWPDATTGSIDIDITKMTQFTGPTKLKTFTQNGYEAGYFRAAAFDETGVLSYSYTNGLERPMYKLPLATFRAPNSLEALSGTLFAESQGSGKPTVAAVGANGKSSLTVAAVELSNVDIAEEFTKMLITQKAYSTAATAFKTADEMIQSASSLIR